MTVKRVGLLSPGEMGHVVGKVLIDHGMAVLTCLEGRSDRTRERAEVAGMKSAADYKQLVEEVDLILSIMVPSEATGVAREVAEVLTRAGESVTYVDCNAVAPETTPHHEGPLDPALPHAAAVGHQHQPWQAALRRRFPRERLVGPRPHIAAPSRRG